MLALSKGRLTAVFGLLLAVLASGTAYATHVRPRGASPKLDALAIAYRTCAQVNKVHGGPATSPLTGLPSCDPVQESPFLTTGTPDANGAAAQMVGTVKQTVVSAPSPSDIKLTADITDVRCRPPIAPNPALCVPNGPAGTPPAYQGMTDVVVPIRVTDHCNYGPGGPPGPCPAAAPSSGTVAQTVILDFPMKCAVPAVVNIGGECSVTTSWNARYGGIVPPPGMNGSRMNIEVGVVHVTDGSDSGQPNPNNNVFATSGLFSP
jgi:hypothetical protein